MREESKRAAQHTISCDRFPWVRSTEPCGSCASCLYRRISLHADGLRSIDDPAIRRYSFDPLSLNRDWNDFDLIPFWSIQSQLSRLVQALLASSPYPALVEAFAEITKVDQAREYLGTSQAEIESQLVRLYRRYVDEGTGFFNAVAWPARTGSDVKVPGSSEAAS